MPKDMNAKRFRTREEIQERSGVMEQEKKVKNLEGYLLPILRFREEEKEL